MQREHVGNVIRYFGQGKEYSPRAALKKVEALEKKHPDREYAVLVNMRSGYSRYQVAQVSQERISLPTEEHVFGDILPGWRDAPPYGHPDRPEWDKERDRRHDKLEEIDEKTVARLKKGLNA